MPTLLELDLSNTFIIEGANKITDVGGWIVAHKLKNL
jgi:hypothetical protein